MEGGFDTPEGSRSGDQLFVLFLARLPLNIEDGFLEHRFGIIVKKTSGDEESYQRIGFVDGFLLQRAYSKGKRLAMNLMRNPDANLYGIMGFPRDSATKEDEVESPNMLAQDPWHLQGTNVVLV